METKNEAIKLQELKELFNGGNELWTLQRDCFKKLYDAVIYFAHELDKKEEECSNLKVQLKREQELTTQTISRLTMELNTLKNESISATNSIKDKLEQSEKQLAGEMNKAVGKEDKEFKDSVKLIKSLYDGEDKVKNRLKELAEGVKRLDEKSVSSEAHKADYKEIRQLIVELSEAVRQGSKEEEKKGKKRKKEEASKEEKIIDELPEKPSKRKEEAIKEEKEIDELPEKPGKRKEEAFTEEKEIDELPEKPSKRKEEASKEEQIIDELPEKPDKKKEEVRDRSIALPKPIEDVAEEIKEGVEEGSEPAEAPAPVNTNTANKYSLDTDDGHGY